jgi:phosphoglycolate phosphatase-like HAD superfamily hydrolase
MTDVVALLRRTRAVLFDFDGPICSVFSGQPAPTVARELREQLAEWGAEVPPDDDPLEVLKSAERYGEKVTRAADDFLTAAETGAVRFASPTPGGAESVRACAAAGLRAAVVSNNSAAAVVEYLGIHDLADVVDAVVGREYGKPDLMKPHPKPIWEALKKLHIGPDVALLIGDSTTDVHAARAASITCIGYANKPGKAELLAGADATLSDMADLARCLTTLAEARRG